MGAKKLETTEWQHKMRSLIARFGSEARVALALGLSQRTVNNYARGIHPPRIDAARRIDDLLAEKRPEVKGAAAASYSSGLLRESARHYGRQEDAKPRLAVVEVGIEPPEQMDQKELINEVRQLRRKVAQLQAQIDRAQEVLAGY